LIDRYESTRSPLDLGGQPDRVRAGSRVSYVPSALVVCRVDVLREIGGFDPTMRVGEDVDLVWRLDEAGYRVRYEPTVVVHHRPRPSFDAWLRQRFEYGRSAAPLARRHRGALAPVRVSGWSAAAWCAALAGWPIIGGLIAAITTALLARKLREVPDGRREAMRLAGLGHLFAGRSLASAITRAWWPLAAVAALVSKRCRRAVLLAALLPPVIDWTRGERPLSLPAYVGLRVLDDLAYGAGVANGVIIERTVDPWVPDLTSWPKTRRPGAPEAPVRPTAAPPAAVH
jgi:mycofactocin system glycosyltransferase